MYENKVKYFLDNHPLVDSSNVDIFVYKGDVTLVGTVTDSKQKKIYLEYENSKKHFRFLV